MRRKKQKTGKIIFTILVLAALCVSGAFVYEYFIANQPKKSLEATKEIINEPKENPTLEPVKEEEEEKEKKVIGKDPIIKYEGEDPNNSQSLTGAITHAGVTDQTLVIRLNIDQYLSSGSCNLSLIKDDTTIYLSTANIIADVSTSTCQGFNIPTSNLSLGNYSIVIKLNSGDKNGTIMGSVEL